MVWEVVERERYEPRPPPLPLPTMAAETRDRGVEGLCRALSTAQQYTFASGKADPVVEAKTEEGKEAEGPPEPGKASLVGSNQGEAPGEVIWD